MKHLLLTALMLLAFGKSFANETGNGDFNNEDELFETIAGGDEGFEFIRYSPEYVQMSIHDDMKVACKKAMCTLFSLNNSGDEFKISFSVGEGEQNFEGGNNIIIVPGSGQDYGGSDSNRFIGLNVSYTYKTCEQEIKVPRSLYIAMNTYMYGLITEAGTTRRNFTPADEAMIIFYSTIIKQATGCK